MYKITNKKSIITPYGGLIFINNLLDNRIIKNLIQESSHAGEFHPYVLTEPCLKVSLHTALHSIKSRKYNYIYGYTNNQCKNKLGFSLCFVLRYLTDAFLYNPFSHFTHFSSLALSCRHTF